MRIFISNRNYHTHETILFWKYHFSEIVKAGKKVDAGEKVNEKSTCHVLIKKGSQTYIGIMSNGEKGILQGPGSDVQLHIPEGVYGLVVGSVFTDNSIFCDKIPNDECIIAPMVEFYINSFNFSDSQKRDKYQIRIPHAADANADETLVKIRKYFSDKQTDIAPHNPSKNQETYYILNKRFVTIYTQHFCKFICTQCNHGPCKNCAKVILYGSITPGEDQTLVCIEPFFCSFLFDITDYEMVSTNMKH